MEAAIKVGGSLIPHVNVLKALCSELSKLAETHRIVVVPGGGDFADAIRKIDRSYRLPNAASHKMALLAMDQMAFLLSHVTPNSYLIRAPEEIDRSVAALPIFLPSKLIFEKGALEPSWDVTSDSITGYLASLLGIKMIVLAKDVDGIFTSNPKTSRAARLIPEIFAEGLLSRTRKTCVDKYLPKILIANALQCYVVNGKYPERLRRILEGRPTVCTLIRA